jgi:hypothetical protein
LKRGMREVAVPAGLEARLLGISAEKERAAGTVHWWKRPLGELMTGRRLAIAACVMMLIAAGWWAAIAVSSWRERETMTHVASLALDIHKDVAERRPAEQLATSDPNAAEAWLQPRIPFPAIMLKSPQTRLTSVSVVKLGDAPAAMTRWEKDGHAYTLLEFVPGSMGLSADFAEKVSDGPAGAAGVTSKVVMWTEPARGCGWVLVMDKNMTNTFTY